MGWIFLFGFEGGIYSCEVSRMGHILVRSGRGRHSCEVYRMGRFGEVSTLGQIFVRVSQSRTDDLRCSQDTSHCRLKRWGTSSCEVRGW
jgi:hypothetical protein